MGNALSCMVNAGTRVYPRDSNGNNGFAMHCDARQPPADGDVGVTFFHIRIAVESTNDVLRKVPRLLSEEVQTRALETAAVVM